MELKLEHMCVYIYVMCKAAFDRYAEGIQKDFRLF